MSFDYADAFGAMTLLDGQITTTSTSAIFPPGQIFYWRGGTGRANTALVRWVKLDNNGCSQGEVLVNDDGQTDSSGVKKASTTDAFSPNFRGLSAATIASNSFGFMIIGGYCEKADLSFTAASGELLTISGSTAGKLTSKKASSFWGATLGLSSTVGTAPFVFAIARTAIATGIGSVQLIGIWG
jgi:hypothetical protein